MPLIPADYADMLDKPIFWRIDDDSTNAFINSVAKKYMGVNEYPLHQPGDERVVMVVEPAHTTQMG